MDRDQVIQVLESLANGIDPSTGARIPYDAFQTPDTIRALFTASTLLKVPGTTVAAQEPGRTVTTTLTSAGTSWSEEEDARLCREFDAKMTVAQIALQHLRSSGAITSRLVKLGRIDRAILPSRDRGARVVAS